MIGAGFGKMEPWNLEAKMETMLEVQHWAQTSILVAQVAYTLQTQEIGDIGTMLKKYWNLFKKQNQISLRELWKC